MAGREIERSMVATTRVRRRNEGVRASATTRVRRRNEGVRAERGGWRLGCSEKVEG